MCVHVAKMPATRRLPIDVTTRYRCHGMVFEIFIGRLVARTAAAIRTAHASYGARC